jgi:hypothetical protein
MATVTLNLDEELMRVTQEIPEERHATVDEVILDLVQRAAADRLRLSGAGTVENEQMERWDSAMSKLAHFDKGGPYTRDELNER